MVLVLTGASDRSAPAAVCFARLAVEVSASCALTATPIPAAAPLKFWGKVRGCDPGESTIPLDKLGSFLGLQYLASAAAAASECLAPAPAAHPSTHNP